jgi:hypothetical protein
MAAHTEAYFSRKERGEPSGTLGALMVGVARGLVFAFGLVGGVSLLSAAQGCTSNETPCSSFQASKYDRSCKVDSDCVVVPLPGDCCPSLAIRVAAQAQYMSDVAGCLPNFCTADCTNADLCCVNGACEYATVDDCHAAPPAEDAAEDTGTDGAPDGAVADAMADACAASGCVGACLGPTTHNVSTMVDGCLVWECCVPDDAGTDGSGPLDGGGE